MIQRKIDAVLLEKYRIYLIRDEKEIATVNKYLHDIRVFAKFAQDKQVDKDLTLAYKNMLEKNYAVRSANSMLAAMNSFLRFVGWDDARVKQFKIQQQAYCKEEKELTKQEYQRLIVAAERKNKRLSLLIQTICSTGIRVSELSYITVESVQKGEAVVSCKGKMRKIFIISALRKKLLQYAKTKSIISGVIFTSKNGNPLNRTNIWKEMKALCQTAHILADKVFPHNLRHLFARTFYAIEKDIAKLADILGHSNINTTRIYIITTGAEHKRRMEQMRLIL